MKKMKTDLMDTGSNPFLPYKKSNQWSFTEKPGKAKKKKKHEWAKLERRLKRTASK